MVVKGAGSGMMEIAADIFGILLGPQECAEIRLNILQGPQAAGGLLVILTATTVICKRVGSITYLTLIDVQWILIAGLFLCVNISELRDTEPRWTFRASTKTLFICPCGLGFAPAIFALFWYVGGQEIMTLYARGFLASRLHTDASEVLTATGRFIAAVVVLIVRPRCVLLVFMVGLVATATAAMAQQQPSNHST